VLCYRQRARSVRTKQSHTGVSQQHGEEPQVLLRVVRPLDPELCGSLFSEFWDKGCDDSRQRPTQSSSLSGLKKLFRAATLVVAETLSPP
jgi:hypothetical protein